MDLLKTRRALVTGVQRGIGRAIAEAYAGQAAALILVAEPNVEDDLNQVILRLLLYCTSQAEA
jgi:NAD(P)-dependent dehydrogenase (short-subunit alcohol dehydrogenase family)